MGGLQNWNGRFGEEKNLLPLPKMNIGSSSRWVERGKLNDRFHLEVTVGR
jgi:hypothetical protein